MTAANGVEKPQMIYRNLGKTGLKVCLTVPQDILLNKHAAPRGAQRNGSTGGPSMHSRL